MIRVADIRAICRRCGRRATAYGAIEETILTEIVANSLDSGASRIRIEVDPVHATLTVSDNGSAGRNAFRWRRTPSSVTGPVLAAHSPRDRLRYHNTWRRRLPLPNRDPARKNQRFLDSRHSLNRR